LISCFRTCSAGSLEAPDRGGNIVVGREHGSHILIAGLRHKTINTLMSRRLGASKPHLSVIGLRCLPIE
jgi:hypothetical protein